MIFVGYLLLLDEALRSKGFSNFCCFLEGHSSFPYILHLLILYKHVLVFLSFGGFHLFYCIYYFIV